MIYYYSVSNGEKKVLLEMNSKLPSYLRDVTNNYFCFMEGPSFEEENLFKILINFNCVDGYLDDLAYESCSLHCKKEGVLKRSPDRTEIVNLTDHITYVILPDKKIRMEGKRNYEMMNEIIRLLRVCFEILLEEKGFIKLHMGILGCCKKVFGVVGKPNGGKTTLILELLEKNKIDFFCSNDKSFVNRNLECYGICQRIGIRAEAYEKYIGKAEKNIKSEGKVYMWPNELMKIFDTNIVNKTKINGIICCDFCLSEHVKVLQVEKKYKEEFYPQFIKNYTDDANMNRIKEEIVSRWGIKNKEVYGIIEKEIKKILWKKISGNYGELANLNLLVL